MKAIKCLFFLLILIISFYSCKKTEGEGGTSTIKGKVLVKEYNYNFTELLREYYAQGEDVYIVYGEEAQVGDRVETYHDGTYQFNYLRKGSYTIYVYSEDNTRSSSSGDIAIESKTEINRNGETVELDDIVIYNATNTTGTSSITGKVWVNEVNSVGNPDPNNNHWAYDEDVFLIRGNDTLLYDDCKTNYNGNYKFEELPIGTYKVYAYSKVFVSGVQKEDEPVIVEVSITSENQNVIAPLIQIEQ